MDVIQKPVIDLLNAEFSRPAMAQSFYPANNASTHLHLGTPTAVDGKIARPGNVFITFIGVKVNGQNLGNIPRCRSGFFDIRRAPRGTPPAFIHVLDALDLLVDGCGNQDAECTTGEEEPTGSHMSSPIQQTPDDPALKQLEIRTMATNYSIDISMSQDTVTALTDGGYTLYAFKGVSATISNGAPLVWFASKVFSLDTVVNWEEQYQAYTSLSEIVPNGSITASAAYDADLDQELEVTSSAGTGAVVDGGTAGAISIFNQTNTQFSCGISQVVDGTASPLCAFPLYGNGLDVMAPVETVLLMFATDQVDTGTVIYKAYSQGVLVDLTGVTDRDVSFDINDGWDWGGYAWGQSVDANADLSPLLIDSSSSMKKMQRKFRQKRA